MRRSLTLKREALAEITTDDLRTVGGAAATIANVCGTGGAITVFVHGCASDPRYCYYVTDFC